jgi:cellulose synthase/poly-beta-1,6-N-acetylglucosamine synthase-like glycosyltransferase
MALVVLGCCTALILYHHLLYPALLATVSQWRSRPPGSLDPFPVGSAPALCLLIPAHNEERFIERKIENSLALRYPADRLSMTVVLDGCVDHTEERTRKAIMGSAARSVKVVTLERNLGKIELLNRFIAGTESELVAVSDASALVDADALLRVARHFEDAKVGVVCGTYRLPPDGLPGERAYWEYQVRIKLGEAAIASPMGAHGAFYVFRRSRLCPRHPHTNKN